MEKRIDIIWKVILVTIVILLSLIPFHFMQQYARSVIDGQSTLTHLVAQSTNYLSGVIDSIQGQSSSPPMLDLKTNYLFVENNLISAPLTLALAFLLLVFIDIIHSFRLCLVNYLVIGIGLILFYFIEFVLAPYTQPSVAFFVPAVFFALLLSCYLTGAIKNFFYGVVFGIGLFMIYTLTFYLVSEINNILIYGAICFVAIFVLIVLATRKIDWNHPAERVKGSAKKLN